MSILPLGQQTATVTRFSTIDFSSGDAVDSIESTFSISGSFQFTQGRERQVNAEGQRNRARLKLFCDPAQRILQTADLAGQRRPDRVNLNGRVFEVAEVFDWLFDVDGCPHMEYELQLVGADEGG